MNPMTFLKLNAAWEKFQKRHPKFSPFLNAVSENGIAEGSVIEINVTTADGHSFCTNLKVCADDMELIQELKILSAKK